MPEEFLKESIIDMVAARHQYAGANESLPDRLTTEMFELNTFYFSRYIESDRTRVVEELERLKAIDWSTIPIQGLSFSK